MISIIIVNYNGFKWLKRCFDSLLSQIYNDFEIVFVDNASNDDSVDFIKKNYSDARIKIIRSKNNLGFAGGNNLGIKNSNGRYVMFLNNDTWIERDFLQKIYDFYITNCFDVIAPYEKDYVGEKRFKKYSIKIDFFGHPIYLRDKIDCQQPRPKSVGLVAQLSQKGFYLSGVCLFFSKKVYQDTQGLDDNFFMYFEEIDWFWRLNLLNKKFSCTPDLFIYHAGAGTTGSGIKYLSFLWRNQNTLQMLLKNYKWFNLLWILPIYFIQNIFEIFFFLLILKTKTAYSYIEGWLFNIKNFRRTMRKRKWVQKNRVIGDYEIMQKMYFGFAKLKHLIIYFRNE